MRRTPGMAVDKTVRLDRFLGYFCYIWSFKPKYGSLQRGGGAGRLAWPGSGEDTMRTTDDRYAGERAQFDLAMRLIRHQARTHIITLCTGFSQDRIRKLYTTYFKHRGERSVRRHRGKSPCSVEYFVRNPTVQSEATLLVHLFAAWGLLRIRQDLAAEPAISVDRLAFGQRFCEAFETFRSLQPEGLISFEHAWNLLTALTQRAELLLLDCADCSTLYVHDALALDRRRCPTCRVVLRTRHTASHGT
jgi:hypothetical protein